jgi:hypothetical protein
MDTHIEFHAEMAVCFDLYSSENCNCSAWEWNLVCYFKGENYMTRWIGSCDGHELHNSNSCLSESNKGKSSNGIASNFLTR